MRYYAKRDTIGLDKAGNYYCRHVGAMTSEALHSKSDIAAELGWRDMEIDRLHKVLEEKFHNATVTKLEELTDRVLAAAGLPCSEVSRFEVIDHTPGGEGRSYVNRHDGRFRVSLSLQDSGRTLKVFLT